VAGVVEDDEVGPGDVGGDGVTRPARWEQRFADGLDIDELV